MEFDRLDEPMPCDQPAAPSDTQTLRFIRCEVCGIPAYGSQAAASPRSGRFALCATTRQWPRL